MSQPYTHVHLTQRPVKCRFGCEEPAVAVWEFPTGCVCFPEDRLQALCEQHSAKARDNVPDAFYITDIRYSI